MKKINLAEAYEALQAGKTIRDINNDYWYKKIDGVIKYSIGDPTYLPTIQYAYESAFFNAHFNAHNYEICEDQKDEEIKHLKTLISKQMPGENCIAACEWAISRIKKLLSSKG